MSDAQQVPAIVILGQGALDTARRVQALYPGALVHGLAGRVEADRSYTDFGDTLRELYCADRPIVALCAAGIVIRSLAPLLQRKGAEPPVLALAEDGSAVVPLLGGLAGVNRLAREIGEVLAVAPAITTSGELRFGTVDCFLLWRLTGGRSHRTDATNASRTLLFNIHSQDWDEELLALFEIPRSLLPEVLDCAAEFGVSEPSLLGAAIPVLGMAGDQQAALIGQACFQPGMVKSTYGTGCFMIQNTGEQPVTSKNRLLTTVGYRLDGKVSYAVEGSIFVAGAAVQWLRDGIKLIDHAHESEALAIQAGDSNGVYLVPAFTGLGAPYWDPKARGAIFGLTRDTGIKEIVTAGLQSVCYQTRDLLEAMRQDGTPPSALRVDGGMVVNNWVMQFLTDILGVTVERPEVTETTALGVAYMAGLKAGFYRDLDDIASHWHLQRRFAAHMAEERRGELYAGWQNAVRRVRSEA